MLFVVDSLALSEVVNGNAVLQGEGVRPVLERVCENLKALVIISGTPMLCDDPVQWRPRRYNKQADWLCNVALNTPSSCEYVDPDVETYVNLHPNWQVHTDGGCRYEGFSAISWVVHAVVSVGQDWHRFTIAFGYQHITGNLASFVAEAMALEARTSTLKSILNPSL